MTNIEFDARLFNNIYFELDKYFNNSDIRYIYLYGGSSSSKSYTIAQRLLIYAMEGQNNNSYVFKLVSSKIDETIFATFKSIINTWQLQDHFIIQKHYIEFKLTGSYISFSGLDNSDKVKGLEGYKKIFIDEIDQIDFDDFKQVKKRLRGMVGQQVLSAFNPVSEMSYIKVDIFDKEEWQTIPTKACDLLQLNKQGDTVVMRTNYTYNKWIVGDGKGGGFIDKHVIADFEKDKLLDINYYNIYAMGHWGKLRTGGEFLKQFKQDKHVSNYSYNAALPLHISFDENVLPYLTCLVFQIEKGFIRQIDEICLEDPRNTLKDTCEEFLFKYGGNQHGLFVYGDATSKKRDTKLEKGQNFYYLVRSYLHKMKPDFRVPLANPSVTMSRRFTDALLFGDIEGYSIGIDKRCTNSITDYQYTQEDEEGKVLKKVVKDRNTGQSYQERGHCVDAFRYLLTGLLLEQYKIFIRG